MIEVVIVAETRFYREGLSLALRDAEGFDVLAAVGRTAELTADLVGPAGRVLLLDVADLPDGPSEVVVLRNRNPSLRVVALGLSERESDIISYAEVGTAGYLTRDNSLPELVRTVESAAKGEMRCSPRIAAALSRRVAELTAELRPSRSTQCLSHREEEVAALLEEGLSNQEISRRLCIALATVKNHVHSILEKLDLQGRADAAAWARRQRLDHATVLRRF